MSENLSGINTDSQVAKGFFSYVHSDNDAERGRIRDLAEHLKAEYELISGKAFSLFRDYEDLRWGDDWLQKIEASLNEIDFFIPIITPNFLQSSACREEFELFRTRLEASDAKKIIFPIVYVPISEKHGPLVTDPIWEYVQEIQYEDWKSLRFEEISSRKYRSRINKCAERLFELNNSLSVGRVLSATAHTLIRADFTADAEVVSNADEGLLEQMSEGFDALNDFAPTLELISADMTKMGELVTQAELNMNAPANSATNPFKQRLISLRKLANELMPVGSRILKNGQALSVGISNIDKFIRNLAESNDLSPEGIQSRAENKAAVESIALSSNESSKQIEEFLTLLPSIEKQSREIRQPLGDIRYGLSLIIEANRVIQRWLDLF